MFLCLAVLVLVGFRFGYSALSDRSVAPDCPPPECLFPIFSDSLMNHKALLLWTLLYFPLPSFQNLQDLQSILFPFPLFLAEHLYPDGF